MLLVFSLNELFKKYGHVSPAYNNDGSLNDSVDESFNSFTYYTPITFRHFKTNTKESFQMNFTDLGYYVTGLLCNTILQRDHRTLDEMRESFWHLARKDTVQLHERLNDGEQFVPSKYPITMLKQGQMASFFGMSNLGAYPNRSSPVSQIKIEKGFTEMSIEPTSVRMRIFFSLFSCIDNQLCFSINSNSCLIESDVIKELSETILNTLDKIISN